MIGEPHFKSDRVYVEVNENGTLEKLPPIGFWCLLWVSIRHHFKAWTVSEIRGFCKNHQKNKTF
jgi:hypothetical protein